MNPEIKLKKLKEMLDIIQEGITRQEFTDAFKEVIKLTTAIEKNLISKIDNKLSDKMRVIDFEISTARREVELEMNTVKNAIQQAQYDLQEIVQETRETNETTFASLKKRALESMDTLFAKMRVNARFDEIVKDCVDMQEKMSTEHEEMMRNVPDTETLIAEVVKKIPPEITAEQVRDKLETLKENERTDKSAIKGIDELEERVKQIELRPTGRTGGAKGFTLYVDGAKKLLTAQTINLIPGAGVSLTYSYANGRNDITISSTGTAISILTATGDIDGVNKDFTFVSKPTIIILNGASYRENAGWSWSGLTATLDSAPISGSDLYGIG